MASDSNAQVLEKIAELKQDIGTVSVTLNTHVKNGDNLNQKDKKDILDAVKDGPDEQKKPWEAFLESIGFKDLMDAFKQLSGWSILILASAAGITFLKDRVLNYGAILNAISNRLTSKVFTIGENGLPARRTRAQVEADNAVSINPHGIQPQLLNDLRTALSGLPPKIHAFNAEMAQTKSASTIKKISDAIGKLAEKLEPDPTHTIKDVAGAVGELHTKLQSFDHEKLPKATTLRGVAEAARDLSRNADNVKRMFQDLGVAFTETANRIGA